MSDPMTRTDIEDVLSSIRRLVSEEARPEPPLRAPGAMFRAADPSAIEPKLTGRLVLTPALRVADVPDAANDGLDATARLPSKGPVLSEGPVSSGGPVSSEAPVPADAALAEPALPEGDAADRAQSLSEQIGGVAIEATIAELESAVAARVEQWDPDGTEAAVEDENHLDAFVGPVRFVHRGTGHATAPEDPNRAPRVAPARLMPESRRRTVEPSAGEAPSNSAAHAGPKARAASISAVDALAETLAQCAEAADALSEPQEAQDAQDATAAPAFHSGRGVTVTTGGDDAHDTQPAPESEAAAIDWEDSVPDEALDLGEDSIPQSAFADLETQIDPQIDLESKDEPAPGGAEADPEGAFLDEEALRDIVREMIRQELQGSLGERITRSVRKLVRAEINRAFASRDFE